MRAWIRISITLHLKNIRGTVGSSVAGKGGGEGGSMSRLLGEKKEENVGGRDFLSTYRVMQAGGVGWLWGRSIGGWFGEMSPLCVFENLPELPFPEGKKKETRRVRFPFLF